MQKPLELNGAAAHLNYPLRLRWYEPHLVPDAIAMAGCVIGINSSQSGELGRIAIAINSSWKTLKFADEGDAAPVIVQQTAPQTVDVEPVLRRVVGEMLPALIPQAPVPALPAPPQQHVVAQIDPNTPEGIQALAQFALSMAEMVNELQSKVLHLEQRLDAIDATEFPVPEEWLTKRRGVAA